MSEQSAGGATMAAEFLRGSGFIMAGLQDVLGI
jgi:hypothetical protein